MTWILISKTFLFLIYHSLEVYNEFIMIKTNNVSTLRLRHVI